MSEASKRIEMPAWGEAETWLPPVESFGFLKRASLLRFLVPPTAWLDCLVIATSLLLVNSIVHPKDIGWLRLHPSPFYLLPILIGSRYGVLAGLSAGTLAMAIVLSRLFWFDALDLNHAFSSHGYFLTGFIIAGGICGEIQHSFRKRELQLTAFNEQLGRRLKKLDSTLDLLLETKAELERTLAASDSELSTLDSDLRRLSNCEGDELYHNILLVLSHHTRVSDAAVYILEAGILRRRGVIGNPEFLPEQLDPASLEIAAVALRQKAPVTVPEFWKRAGGTSRNYLAAVPLVNSRDESAGLLLITGMPFIALHQRTIHGIDLMCRWAVRIIESRAHPEDVYRIVEGIESQRIYGAEFFHHSLEVAQQSYRWHHLPSAVVLFTWPGQPKSLQSHFEQVLISTVRDGDCAAELNLPMPHLAVLLPLTGERGASIFRDRILGQARQRLHPRSPIESRILLLNSARGADEIWYECTCLEKAGGGD